MTIKVYRVDADGTRLPVHTVVRVPRADETTVVPAFTPYPPCLCLNCIDPNRDIGPAKQKYVTEANRDR
ncbi:hypothetical protein [Streptomyces qinzhouensis]|uniref:Uncharacterized protein n=1 Tax=Streptomyces qinzhouensis TaxID=2599401 RepID=A0A5B8JIK0_9ACTN|nr:hypothetical protein [Streptomyces qinzhouensis]QDY77610.1 hypothetical protein FQU76_14955 [Streptomyces qinzhouensis]